jgi:hypothetical protein
MYTFLSLKICLNIIWMSGLRPHPVYTLHDFRLKIIGPTYFSPSLCAVRDLPILSSTTLTSFSTAFFKTSQVLLFIFYISRYYLDVRTVSLLPRRLYFKADLSLIRASFSFCRLQIFAGEGEEYAFLILSSFLNLFILVQLVTLPKHFLSDAWIAFLLFLLQKKIFWHISKGKAWILQSLKFISSPVFLFNGVDLVVLAIFREQYKLWRSSYVMFTSLLSFPVTLSVCLSVCLSLSLSLSLKSRYRPQYFISKEPQSIFLPQSDKLE